MTSGRKICNTLKEIRRRIAEKNDIEYTAVECPVEEECSGTCPQCESEVEYLENELHKRTQLGKAVAVAGIALGMAGTFSACNISKQNTAQNDSRLKSEETRIVKGEANAAIKGRVLDENGTPIEFVNVRLMQNDYLVRGAIANAKGKFSLKAIESGVYDLVVSYIGYSSDTLKSIKISNNEVKIVGDIKIKRSGNITEGIIMRREDIHILDSFDIGIKRWIRKNGEFILEW